jgi:CHAT domain-containing protein
LIHIASHGWLDESVPMASGVLLTPPRQEPGPGATNDDGVLQAWEVFSQLQLRADLAVLSACQTGRGRIVHHEGVIGLPRALIYAGCRAVVATQWQVSDTSTSSLMAAFHRFLRQGNDKDEALMRSIAVLQAQKTTAHPYHWAAFFVTGDPANHRLTNAIEKPTVSKPAPTKTKRAVGKAHSSSTGKSGRASTRPSQ